jgi:crossover junction endodeoxyribonuclease RusA
MAARKILWATGGTRMAEPMTITVPVPVSANRLWRKFRGRMVLNPAARVYKDTVAKIALAAGMRPMTGDVELTIRVYCGARKLDADNCCKLIGDSLQGIAYMNDAQVTRVVSERRTDKANPRAEVTVTRAA